MRKTIIHLSVAVLTFAIGIIASTLLYGVVFPPAEKVNKTEVAAPAAAPPAAPVIMSETVSSRCGCSQSFTEAEPASEEASPKAPIRGGVLNGKAISLPMPAYPPIARAARASGAVVVQIVVDERGCIQTAHAASGHPLLQAAAVQAARQACFSPTRLSGQPVKVSGALTYNFVLQ